GLSRGVNSTAPAALSAVGGSLAVLGGCAMVAPVVVGRLERWVAPAPTSVRLAGRSLARSRVRSSAVVAAVVAATSVLVAGSTMIASASVDQHPLDDRPDLARDLVVLHGIDGAGT